MFKRNSIFSLFFATFVMLCAVVFCAFTTQLKTENYASAAAVTAYSDTNMPEYLSISTTSATYTNGDTIFLQKNQILTITLGKPAHLENISATSQFSNQDDIGDYALAGVEKFSYTVNNVTQNLGTISDYVKFDVFTYSPKPNLSFSYFTLNIDLSACNDKGERLFPSGKYEFNFYDLNEYSQADFSYNQNASLTFKLYIFNTTEYFSSDSASSQNTTFDNVEHTTPNAVSYNNYYYFNYSNLNTSETDFSVNYLPKLSFDPTKFVVNISKSVAGNTYACEINSHNTNLVTLNNNTTSEFLTAKYNATTNQVEVYFYDLGEYVIEYTYIYEVREKVNEEYVMTELIELESNEISAISQKDDVLYVFGYQMYYAGKVDESTQFKALNEDKSATLANKSADITYLIEKSNILNIKSVSQTNISSDNTIFSKINTLSPVSTNQPIIVLNTNAKINTSLSHYYTYNTTENKWGDAVSFDNTPFSESGKYLLKVVYTYDHYLTTTAQLEATIFVQYFYFEISATTPTVDIEEIISGEEPTYSALTTNSFTKNNVRITLPGQSIFNSNVKVEIYHKAFSATSFSGAPSTFEATEESTQKTVNGEGNYWVKLIYGSNQTKSKSIYFTIDTTSISGVSILPIEKNTITGNMDKDNNHPVSFFTRNNVVVQWDEKTSGAQIQAYYKYIPFVQNTDSVTSSIGKSVSGITTTQMLNLDVNKTYDKATYTNTLNVKNPTHIFSNQGLYIFYLIDEAGNEKTFSFCIDKSSIQIIQTDAIDTESQDTTGYNIQWGDYKLISINCTENEITNIQDNWVKNAIYNLYHPSTDSSQKIKAVSSTNNTSKLYFAVEINSVYALQTGTTLKLITNNNTGYDYISFIETTSQGLSYFKEITYTYYLIDEGNKYYSEFASMYGKTASSTNAENFAENADKTFQITTSSDESEANILINNSNSLAINQSVLSSLNQSLNQAGFADSNTGEDNIRTKYYLTTGSTEQSSVNMLTYKIKLDIGLNPLVAKVVLYYYPFTVDATTGVSTLSSTAQKAFVVYDRENNINSMIALTGENNTGYYAYNINVGTNTTTNTYQTLPGKYVVVREYSNSYEVGEYDYKIRESVFIVDREDIVSSPEAFGDGSKSAVGSGIFVNVLDGNAQAVKFTNIYSAKNNTNTYILQTNKLPVVVYVPIAKYGNADNFTFTKDTSLSYFLSVEDTNKLIRFSYMEDTSIITEKSTLSMIYFGDEALIDNFDTNANKYQNSDFDLSVTITSSNGEIIATNITNSTYIASTPITKAGTYYVTITQNSLNGKNYPNVYNTFKFSFQIIESLPEFDFTDSSDTKNYSTFNQDNNGVYYTNNGSEIKVIWVDPIDTKFYAKVDTSTNENGYTKITYKNSSDGVAYNVLGNDIKTIEPAGDSTRTIHYFTIDISKMNSGQVLEITMQNECGNILDNTNISSTKYLYIDRIAPTNTLTSLMEKTKIDNTNLDQSTFAKYTRKNVNFDGSDTNDNERYNVLITSGALSKYAFAVSNENGNFVKSLAQKVADNNYYNDVYYFHIEKVKNNNLSEYTMPNISSALATTKAYQTKSNITLSINTYYEVIEMDLAGNLAIYLIYVVDPNYNGTVMSLNSDETDFGDNASINYSAMQDEQEIFARMSLEISGLDLYNYPFLEFSLDGTTYIKSSSLSDSNKCYNFSKLSNISSDSSYIDISSLLSFSAPSYHKLIINDSVIGKNYTFNIYVNDSKLVYNLISSGEGIIIQSNTIESIKHVLKSITISSYNKSISSYVTIYEATDTFTSNSYVTANTSGNTYTFKIISPNIAYSYSFKDNYGVEYVDHHTVGSFVLSENQRVQNNLGTKQITETIDDKQTTNDWYVGTSNIIYNFSSADYYAYIKIEYLSVSSSGYEWKTYSTSVESEYGIPIGTQSSYYITDGRTTYCAINNSSLHDTVRQITLYAPSQNLLSEDYTGNIFKFKITLVNLYDSTSEQLVIDRILINNLTPQISLLDKNNEKITTDNAIYTEQITVSIPSLPENLTENTNINIFLLDQYSYISYNDSTQKLTSGLTFKQAGIYVINVYVLLNNNNYILTTKTFIISDTPTVFYQVLVKDPHTGEDVEASTTGNYYSYGSTLCYKHYIVNDDYTIYLTQDMTSTEFVIDNVTTIYTISNLSVASSNPSITPYSTTIAVSYIPKTTSIISNAFTYSLDDASYEAFSGTSNEVKITQSNKDLDTITIKFRSYYLIKENLITATVQSGDTIRKITGTSEQNTTFTISQSGEYLISFSDIAGNMHLFNNTSTYEQTYYYKLRFIKGVPYLINGQTPIQNGIYNDKVEITVPSTLNNIYDTGSKPAIVVLKNDKQIEVKAVDGVYTLNEIGYYTVYFTAQIQKTDLRHESYSFSIISSTELKSSFEFTEYGNYEISTIIKDNEDITTRIKQNYNLSETDALKSLALYLADEETGSGTYTVTIATNSGLFTTTSDGSLQPEQFTFSFKIEDIDVIPLTISIDEGASTTDTIKIEFNAYDLYDAVGECKVTYGKSAITVNQSFLDTLSEGKYYQTLEITETGTYFVQVYSASNELLYSYKVTKNEPLNTVSILLIVGGVLVAAGLTVTIVLLRKKMKIK